MVETTTKSDLAAGTISQTLIIVISGMAVLIFIIFIVLLFVFVLLSKIMNQQKSNVENHNHISNINISDDGVIGDNWDGQSAHTYMSFRSSGSSHIYEDIDENGSSAEHHRYTQIDLSPDYHHSNTDNQPVEDANDNYLSPISAREVPPSV